MLAESELLACGVATSGRLVFLRNGGSTSGLHTLLIAGSETLVAELGLPK